MGVDFGVIWAADCDNAFRFHIRRPARRLRVTRRPPFHQKRNDRYSVMGISFGVIGAADFKNAIRSYDCRPTRRSRVTRRPPSHQNIKITTDISLWVSILGLFGPLISITTLDFMSTDLPAG